ncbi:MAG: hypothetical protein OXG43_13520 [Chloroflexi bacterium]|nr:hypothetical protein [Chloroflexota bacterium]
MPETSVSGKAERLRRAATVVILALGTAVILAVAACGEEAAPPETVAPTAVVDAPTPRPDTPAAATPTPTPTATPTATLRPTATPAPTPRPSPAAPTEASLGRAQAVGFDATRFEDALQNVAGNATRVSIDLGPPIFKPGEFTMMVETGPAGDSMRTLMTTASSGRPLSIEMLRVENMIFARGHDADGNWTPWVGSIVAEDLAMPLGAMGTAIEDLEALGVSGDDPGYSVIGKVGCSDGQTCFLLQLPDFGEGQFAELLVDTETYLPVVMRLRLEGFPGVYDMLIDWNADVDITAPQDAPMLTSEEFTAAVSRLVAVQTGAIVDANLPDPAAVGGPEAGIVELIRLLPELGALPDAEARDGIDDLFHPDLDSANVRSDSTIDIDTWGAGVVDLSDAGARALFGPDGALACGPANPAVVCGATEVAPGRYLVVWMALVDEFRLDDDSLFRSFWAVFDDGDPANDPPRLPMISRDVLESADQNYRIEATRSGWRLVRTFGPEFERTPTGGAAIVVEDVVLFWVPVSELGDLEALSLGVASSSGSNLNPFGPNGAFDRSPDPGQPLTPLEDVLPPASVKR